MRVRAVIPFLTDNNVPDSVGTYLRRRGHDVVRVREIMASDSADPIVAEAAIRDNRVLISWDKDFNAQKFQKPRFAGLHRLAFSCPEPHATNRLKAVIDRVEYEYAQASTKRPMLLKIGNDRILIRC